MSLLTGKAGTPPPVLYYVAVGLGKVDGKLYKKLGWAARRVRSEEAKGNVAQIWRIPAVGWVDITSDHSDPELQRQGLQRQAWGTDGGSLRKLLLSSGAAPVDFVRTRPRLEAAVDWIDAAAAHLRRR